MSAPERTCIGCRSRRPQSELVRLRLCDGEVQLGARGGKGRSVYLCPEPSCLEGALQRRAFARAFRAPASVDALAAGRFFERATSEGRWGE